MPKSRRHGDSVSYRVSSAPRSRGRFARRISILISKGRYPFEIANGHEVHVYPHFKRVSPLLLNMSQASPVRMLERKRDPGTFVPGSFAHLKLLAVRDFARPKTPQTTFPGTSASRTAWRQAGRFRRTGRNASAISTDPGPAKRQICGPVRTRPRYRPIPGPRRARFADRMERIRALHPVAKLGDTPFLASWAKRACPLIAQR